MSGRLPHWAVVCGLVRDPHATLSIFQRLLSWQREGLLDGVVVSTWLGEIDKIPRLREILGAADFVLVESPPPQACSMGNILHQMKSLHLGLAACPDDAFVLKLRTDKITLTDRHEHLLRHGCDDALDPGVALWSPFTHRIRVDYAHIRIPFYFGDLIFAGRAPDLRRLIHFDGVYDVLGQGPGVSAEMRFFSHPFLAAYPILGEYFACTEAIFGLTEHTWHLSAMVRDYVLDSPYFLRVLATYHLLLARCFAVGFPPVEDFESWCASTRVHELDADEIFYPRRVDQLRISHDARRHRTASDDTHWLRALLAGRFRPSAFGDAYRRTLDEVGDPAFHADYAVTPWVERPEVRAFVDGMERLFGLRLELPRITRRGRTADVAPPSRPARPAATAGAPYLSLVLVSRNDDHGGDMLRRLQTSLDNTLGLLERHAVPAELVLVEWNPPADAPALVDAVRWPAGLRHCTVRHLRVDAARHAAYADAHLGAIHLAAGVNAGIRRARGAFVLPTTMDHLYPEALIAFLAERRLRPRTLYRVDRVDVDGGVGVLAGIDARLAWCAEHVLRVHAIVPHEAEHYFPLLHTNACGDFQLLDRDSWHALRGYREADFVGWQCDTLFSFAAHAAGIRERVLPDHRLFHIAHAGGRAGKLALERGPDGSVAPVFAGKPVPPWSELEGFVREMVAGRRPYVLNDETWGCGDTVLPETVVARAAWDAAASPSQPGGDRPSFRPGVESPALDGPAA